MEIDIEQMSLVEREVLVLKILPRLDQDRLRSVATKALGAIKNRQNLGTELFDSIALKSVSVAVEAVCLAILNSEIVVYLTQRSATDTAYPGEWHCPGSVLRPTENITDVFARLEQGAFKGTTIIHHQFVANVNHPQEKRGHFFSLVYLCVAGNNVILNGRWVPVDKLNTLKVVNHHKKRIIPAALGAFVARTTSLSD